MEDGTRYACSLDRTEQEARLEEIAELASQALLDARQTIRGAQLRLENSKGVRAQLRRLIDAEAKCCPFLHFEMRLADEAVLLEVSGPPEARPLIDRLFGAREEAVT